MGPAPRRSERAERGGVRDPGLAPRTIRLRGSVPAAPARPADAAAKRARRAYFLIAVAALGLITTANRVGARGLEAAAPGLLWLATLCIPSLVVCLLIYLAARPSHPFALPRPDTPWDR